MPTATLTSLGSQPRCQTVMPCNLQVYLGGDPGWWANPRECGDFVLSLSLREALIAVCSAAVAVSGDRLP